MTRNVRGPFVMLAVLWMVVPICVGQTTLSVMWRTPLNDVGISPVGAPAIDHDRIFWASDRVQSYDRLTGRLVWSVAPGKLLPHGLTVSDGIVYEAEGRVSAIRESDGSFVWSVAVDRGSEFATPAVVGSKLLVGTDEGRVVSLDSRTGKAVGELDCDPKARFRSIVTGLSVQGDTLYVSLTSWDDDKGLSSHGVLVAANLEATLVKWSFRSENNRTRSGFTGACYFLKADVLVLDGLANRVYRVSHDGHQLWVASGVARSFSVAEPLLFIGGTIIMGSADANVYAVDALSGKIVWGKHVHGSVNAMALCGERVAVFGSDMSVLNQNGEIEWGPFAPEDGQQFSSRLVADGAGIVIAGPSALYSLKCSQHGRANQ